MPRLSIANRMVQIRSFVGQAPTALFCDISCVALMPSKQMKGNKDPSAVTSIDCLLIVGFTITITSFLASIQCWGQGAYSPAAILLAIAIGPALGFSSSKPTYYAEHPLIPLSLLKTTSSVFFTLQALMLFGRQAICLPAVPFSPLA